MVKDISSNRLRYFLLFPLPHGLVTLVQETSDFVPRRPRVKTNFKIYIILLISANFQSIFDFQFRYLNSVFSVIRIYCSYYSFIFLTWFYHHLAQNISLNCQEQVLSVTYFQIYFIGFIFDSVRFRPPSNQLLKVNQRMFNF